MRPKLWEEDGGAGESTIILISLRLAGLYTPLMMDKILHSLAARNTSDHWPTKAQSMVKRLICRSEFYSMSDLSKTPILFTPPEVRYKHLLPNVTNPAFFARVILSGPGAGGKVPDGWLMGLHQGFIPAGRFNSSIYVPRQPLSPSIYLCPIYLTKLLNGQKQTFVTNDL